MNNHAEKHMTLINAFNKLYFNAVFNVYECRQIINDLI